MAWIIQLWGNKVEEKLYLGVREHKMLNTTALFYSVQTNSGAHPASYPMGTWGSFPGGLSSRNVKLTTHLHLMPGSGKVELYLHSTIRLHGVVLNSLGTGITLRFADTHICPAIIRSIRTGIRIWPKSYYSGNFYSVSVLFVYRPGSATLTEVLVVFLRPSRQILG
jgi:hypothetical protein